MAQVDSSNNPNDPNNPNNAPGNVNQPNQPGGANQPATSGGAGGVTATGAGNVTGQVVGTNNPSQPFQNIAAYLAANAPQSETLANQVAGTVAAPITQANTDITNAANQFTQSVNTGYTPENAGAISAVTANPTAAVAQGPQTVQDFLANFQGNYTGPTDFTTSPNYANIEAEVANANAAAANTQTQPGVQTLLKQTEGPTTAGINNLDALLLNLNPSNLSTIQSAAAPAANLTPMLSDATTAGNAQAQAAMAAVKKAQQDAQGAFGTASGNLTTGVNSELENAVNAYKGSQSTLNDYIKGIAQPGLSGLKVQQLLQAGVDPAVIQAYTGLPTVVQEMLSGWNGVPSLGNAPGSTEWTFPEAGAAPTAAQVATPEDYATLAALTQLSGGSQFNAPISAADASQAGTYISQNLTPKPNNQALAQDLYGYLNSWSNLPGITPVTQGGATTATADYASLMNGIAQYLGLPAFNPNYPPPPPPPGGGGPPFLGPPRGDVHSGGDVHLGGV
jgi:hypothetical protein